MKIGDTVKLKSGGPLMTVGYLQSDGNILCYWFNSNSGQFEVKWSDFHPDMLKQIDP